MTQFAQLKIEDQNCIDFIVLKPDNKNVIKPSKYYSIVIIQILIFYFYYAL